MVIIQNFVFIFSQLIFLYAKLRTLKMRINFLIFISNYFYKFEIMLIFLYFVLNLGAVLDNQVKKLRTHWFSWRNCIFGFGLLKRHSHSFRNRWSALLECRWICASDALPGSRSFQCRLCDCALRQTSHCDWCAHDEIRWHQAHYNCRANQYKRCCLVRSFLPRCASTLLIVHPG